ncbi:hypothetical protein A7K94_0214150, partial [Modestobacter sp. VKM Ac-2676]
MELGEQQGLRADSTGLAPLQEQSAEGRLIDRLVHVALAQQDVLALADRERQVRYADVLREAEAVRAAVRDAQDDGRPVCVLRQPGVGAVVAVVGVIAAGVPVVVLDSTTPARGCGTTSSWPGRGCASPMRPTPRWPPPCARSSSTRSGPLSTRTSARWRGAPVGAREPAPSSWLVHLGVDGAAEGRVRPTPAP